MGVKLAEMSCGCDPMPKKDTALCQKCNNRFCLKHIYSYVDESNGAITKNSPLLCFECYNKTYK